MEEHVRARIRAAVLAVLQPYTSFWQVAKGRTRPSQPEEMPVVLVYTPTEASSLANMRRSLARELTVVIEIWAATLDDDLDDRMDALCKIAEDAMECDPLFGRIAINSWLASTTIGRPAAGDTRMAVAALEYRVTCRT